MTQACRIGAAAGGIIARLAELARDFMRAAETPEQKSLSAELLELTAALDPGALAGEINSRIARALEEVSKLNVDFDR